MEKFLQKNLRTIAIILLFLFMIKSFQTCVQKTSIRKQEKKITLIKDSLDKEILAREYLIKDLTYELKIAGVRVDEAQKRAEAVQATAEKIKTNTTIKIEGGKGK